MANNVNNFVDQASMYVGNNITTAQTHLMEAYALREGAEAEKLKDLAKKLGIKTIDENTKQEITPDLKGLQLVAEQRFQHANQVFTMFSTLLDKIDQMKQRLIQKFGQG
jgi:hypothetical protein